MCTRVCAAICFRNSTSRPTSVVPASTMQPTPSRGGDVELIAEQRDVFRRTGRRSAPVRSRTRAHSNDRCSWNSVAAVPSESGATSFRTVRITAPRGPLCAAADDPGHRDARAPAALAPISARAWRRVNGRRSVLCAVIATSSPESRVPSPEWPARAPSPESRAPSPGPRAPSPELGCGAGPIRGVLQIARALVLRVLRIRAQRTRQPEFLFTAAIVIGAWPFSRHFSSVPIESKVSGPSPPRQWPMPGTMNRRASRLRFLAHLVHDALVVHRPCSSA